MQRRKKVIAQRLFIVVTVPLVSLCATFIILYALIPLRNPTIEVEKTTPTVARITAPVAVTDPTQLTIKNLNISAPITPQGLTSEGDMAIDEDPEQVAWYRLGPKPGEEGSAVIAGHYGWKNGVASVFTDLNKLVKGDEISMTGKDGRVMTFVVTRTEIYAPDQDATSVFKSDDGKAHLNLITCQGSWNNSLHTYSERLVVFTDLVE